MQREIETKSECFSQISKMIDKDGLAPGTNSTLISVKIITKILLQLALTLEEFSETKATACTCSAQERYCSMLKSKMQLILTKIIIRNLGLTLLVRVVPWECSC